MSVFVTNFPDGYGAKDLWNTCKLYRHVVDVFIPDRRTKAGKRFGFVRFIKVLDIDRLINNLCTVMIVFQDDETKKRFQFNLAVGSWFSQIIQAHNDFVIDERVIWVEVEGVPFLRFQKDDVRGWVFRCDQFLLIDNTPNEEKEVYKKAIVQRFGSIFEDPMSALKNAKYDKSAKEYQDMFDTLLCRVTISQEHAITLYLGGLPTKLKMSVRMFKPATLTDAYSLTRLQEVILEAVKKKNKPTGSFTSTRFSNGGNYENTSKHALFPKPNTPVNTSVNAPYAPGHKYAGQQFSLVLVPDEEDCFEDCLEEDSIEVSQEMPQISLHAINEVQNYRTLRVKGTVGKHTIHILVDYGSTHNFVDVVVAKKLGCPIRSICPLSVTMGDGYNVATTSECKQFKWQLQGVNFCSDVMLLPLVGCEMILGLYNLYYAKYGNPTQSSQASGGATLSKASGGNNYSRLLNGLKAHTKKARTDPTMSSEFERYINSDMVTHLYPKEFATFDVLGFWKEKETMSPILSCMAMDLISVQASSVASESVFSTSGRCCSQDWIYYLE
uniref:Uncharacterized protein n=1 Tax=Tanacetum cinerariifolium TaxID=118510 RepID=A0A6L2LRS1_TANCI|nr:hypothetical protein [Tanacetum cinerariifolium]